MVDIRILQYNVHKSTGVVRPLLEDRETDQYHVIALQESNMIERAAICPSSCAFVAIWQDREARVSILVNKKLNPNSWEARFLSPDMVSLRVQTGEGILWIHNCYSSPPGCRTGRVSGSPIHSLGNVLQQEGEHLVVGDFNVHHPLWCSIRNPTTHELGEKLAETLSAYQCELLTPQGLITFTGSMGESTIDLAFATPELASRVVKCAIAHGMINGSDHKPVEVVFQAPLQLEEPRRARQWRKVDASSVRVAGRDLDISGTLQTKQSIDDYAEKLDRQLQEIVDREVPWTKPSRRQASWWTFEVQRARDQERRAYQEWATRRTPALRAVLESAQRAKRKAIHEARTRSWREMAEKSGMKTIWKLSRWGREANKATAVMPPLARGANVPPARTLDEKAELLKARFYPEVSADLSDIQDSDFPEESFRDPVPVSSEATAGDIQAHLRTRSNASAPGHDEVPYSFLKLLGRPFCEAVARLTNACWKLGHFPTRFKRAKTVVIRKPNKSAYDEPRAWRPIALLCTTGKLIEAVTAERIRLAAEEFRLLPEEQMGFRNNRSTESALDLLTSQVREIWANKDYVASILSFDISGAFDTVVPLRLLDNLRRRRMPRWIVKFVESFMSDRSTTLVLPGGETELFPIGVGTPQGSPLSVVLFLFYNAGLFDLCRRPGAGISGVGFADDLTALVYSKSTERNCAKLEELHRDCLRWARKHGMAFAPDKYELIHMTRATKRFNLSASVNLGTETKNPVKEVRVLGVWIDPKLTWAAHARKMQGKLATQMGALTRIAASTWGPSLAKARVVYKTVVRSAITYASPIWHEPSESPSGIARKLARIQNKGLRVVAGAYRATPTKALETETYVEPIHLYMNKRSLDYADRVRGTAAEAHRLAVCEKIRARIRGGRSGPETRKERWAKEARELGGGTGDGYLEKAWQTHWGAQEESSWGVYGPPDKAVLKLHSKLRKAESSALIQLRTGRVGLASFLHKKRVPGYTSGRCRCDEGRGTPEHFLLQCELHDYSRSEWLGTGTRPSFRDLVSNKDWVEGTVRWVLKSGELRQFELAARLLYDD